MKVWGLLFSLLLIPFGLSAQSDPKANIGVDPEINHALEQDDVINVDSSVLAKPIGDYQDSTKFSRNGDNDLNPNSPFTRKKGNAKPSSTGSRSSDSNSATE